MITENRLVDIEIKIARQEDLVDALNHVVYEQQKKIDRLEAMISALARHVKESGNSDGLDAGNEKPPHY